MKTEALKLLDKWDVIGSGRETLLWATDAYVMIRRLVEELDKQWQQGFAQGRITGRNDFIKNEIDTPQTKNEFNPDWDMLQTLTEENIRLAKELDNLKNKQGLNE